MPLRAGVALGRRRRRLGHAHHHVGLDRSLLGELLAHADPGLVHAAPVERAVGAGEVHELEQAQPGLDAVELERTHRPRPVASITTISPGSSSRTKWAPTMSSAGDSEASTHPPSSRPRHNGRKPFGSRTPMMWSASASTNENAPSSVRQHLVQRALERAVVVRLGERVVRPSSCASSSATRSLSLVTVPGNMPASSASASVFTRLPLWPSANSRSPDVAVHRLRVAPRARAGGRVARVADREVAGERGEGAIVEGVGHEAHVLHDGERVPVAHGHARGLLATVLQCVEAEVGQVSDVLARRIDAEDPASLLGSLILHRDP